MEFKSHLDDGPGSRLLRLFLFYFIIVKIVLLANISKFSSVRAVADLGLLILASTAILFLFSGRWPLRVLAYFLIAGLAFWELLLTLQRLYEFDFIASFGKMGLAMYALNALAVLFLAGLALHSLRIGYKLHSESRRQS